MLNDYLKEFAEVSSALKTLTERKKELGELIIAEMGDAKTIKAPKIGTFTKTVRPLYRYSSTIEEELEAIKEEQKTEREFAISRSEWIARKEAGEDMSDIPLFDVSTSVRYQPVKE